MEFLYPSNIKCVACRIPIPKTNTYSLCKECFHQVEFIEGETLLCTKYEGLMVRLIHDLKYNGKTFLAEIFGVMMKDKLESISLVPDYITFIPSSVERKKERGYNQAQLLAEALADLLDVKCIPLLRRVKDTKVMSPLNPLDRLREISGAFAPILTEENIQGKKIILVDDILTTGVTMGEAAEVIRAFFPETELETMALAGNRPLTEIMGGDYGT